MVWLPSRDGSEIGGAGLSSSGFRPTTMEGVALSWFQATTATTMTAMRPIAAASTSRLRRVKA